MKTLKSSEEFVEGKNDIVWIGSNFKEHFHGLTFNESPSKGLKTRVLGKQMNATKILSELRPEPVSLGDVLAALKTLDKSGWYIFYVEDMDDELWAVYADWLAAYGGWGVGASSVADPSRWNAVYQVVSRRFSDTKKQTLSPSDTLSLEKRIEALEQWRDDMRKALIGLAD